MAGNLKAIAALQAEIEAEGFRGISKQELLDTLQSLAKVGGTQSLKQELGVASAPLTAGFNRIDVWETSRDTQGVQEGLDDPTDPGGWYEIKPAASGDYTVNSSLRFTVDIEGLYTLRVGVQDGVTGDKGGASYQDAAVVPVGVTAQLSISGGIVKGLGKNDRIYMEMKGENGAIVTAYYGQFGIVR
jgi:hypothetical protein